MVWYLTREEEDSWRSQDIYRIPRDEEDPRRGPRVTAHRTRADGGADADNACSTGESRGHTLMVDGLHPAWQDQEGSSPNIMSIVYNKCKFAHIHWVRCLLCAPDHSQFINFGTDAWIVMIHEWQSSDKCKSIKHPSSHFCLTSNRNTVWLAVQPSKSWIKRPTHWCYHICSEYSPINWDHIPPDTGVLLLKLKKKSTT